ARLMVLDRATDAIQHRQICDLPDLLEPGDLIVANRSRVLQSRLQGQKTDSGGLAEITLIRPVDPNTWEALLHAHRIRTGQRIELAPDVSVTVGEPSGGGR